MVDERDANVVPDFSRMLRLDETVQVVLGAGLGIGRQTAHALSSVGARVVCVDVDADRAKTVAAEVDGIPWAGDLTSRDDVADLFRFVADECGRLDGVVDIVGGARYKAMIELTDDDWTFHHNVVLRHAYLTLQYAAEYWRASGTGGTVTFVASVAGLTSAPMTAAYGAHKAALMSLVRTAAVELGPEGIRVNAVAPGVVRTPRAQANPKWTDDLLESNIEKTPLRRLAVPADVAAGALFFSTPMSGHVTGQTLIVDGGNTIVYNVDTPGA
ncbi:SDR family NAD(P)-dependent oxidoreductase [Williamsia muralis]|uniref:Short-chain dehydrogenase n=1 Tax=Williamsia marianensis TaxID=85044 RepID=A0A2G3PGF7_WILMA|nr:SDR family oxidoreductase [Williamsia marianensis]PHV64888.1 short-chain dehydrogenase [Williamsia marianensis]